ncbi:MAG: DUF4864 domain-containing protein [Verrucomicrobiota bacterium]
MNVERGNAMNRRGKLSLLLFCFCLCATAVLIHREDQTRREPSHPAELFQAIRDQVAAYRSDDVPFAYAQVSSTFQQKWTLDEFTRLVRVDFAKIRKSNRVEFGSWQQRGRHAVVEVFFVGQDGNVSPCIFTLINEAEIWKVDGARWVKDWPIGRKIRGIQS